MRWRRFTYSVHRWLGLIVSLQLLAWSAGGFTFSILDIDDVRGDLDRAAPEAPPLNVAAVSVSPAQAVEAIAGATSARSIAALRLRQRLGRSVYEFFDTDGRPIAAVDAVTGHFIERIAPEDARRAALADFTPEAKVESVTLLEGQPPLEYRGGDMPVYRVILDHPKEPHLYISPVTGEVLKRRNRLWRTFDFFWMLHIMDYRNRDNFNHWLLTTMSALALLTSATGLMLWGWRIPSARRRARNVAPRHIERD